MCQLHVKFKLETILENGRVFAKRKLWFDWRTYFKKELQVEVIDFFEVGVGLCVGVVRKLVLQLGKFFIKLRINSAIFYFVLDFVHVSCALGG